MKLFLEWMWDTGDQREVTVYCPECKGDIMGYQKYFWADSQGTFFRCRWCGAKIYQQNGFKGFVDDDGNPREDDYDPMLRPVDPEIYDSTKKLIPEKKRPKVQEELVPNTKQKGEKPEKAKVKPDLKWDEKGFKYSNDEVRITPPGPLYKELKGRDEMNRWEW